MQIMNGTQQTHGPAEPIDGDAARSAAYRRGPRFSLASGARPLDGYTIKRGVGVGGFGEVYYATSDAGKEVALKRIQRNLEIELRGVRQCLNLKHPNLVALYDIKYDQDDQAWVVMEFVAGDSLQQVIERHPQGMPRDQLHAWFGGIAAGVAHLHDCGIVHRDLKPANIFLDDGVVKIGDYGLSKFISCSRRSGQTQSVGTFHYMAPEIGQGRYGKEIDVYAVGIMLYEMLTGRVPYDGESSQEIIMKHLTAQPDLRGIPSPYREVISKALAKDPALRTSSVAEMSAAVLGPAAAECRAPRVGSATPLGPDVSPTLAEVRAVPEEPIAKAVRAAWRDLADGWQRAELGTATRVLILVVTIPLLLFNAEWLIPLGVAAMVIYAIYAVLRAVILGKSIESTRAQAGHAPPSPGAQPLLQTVVPAGGAAASSGAAPRPIVATPLPATPYERRRLRQVRRQEASLRRQRERPAAVEKRLLRAMLKEKRLHQHAREATGAFLLSAMVCVLVGVTVGLFRGMADAQGLVERIPVYAWVVAASTLMSWSVLFLSKGWETSHGDAVLRRLAQLAVGLILGLLVWGLAAGLQIQPSYAGNMDDFLGMDGVARYGFPNSFYDAGGQPRLPSYLAYFGGLFLLVRWWRLADPARSTRLAIGATLLCVVGAFALQALVPMPFSPVIVATSALAVQVAAPYVDRDQRRMICQNTQVPAGTIG